MAQDGGITRRAGWLLGLLLLAGLVLGACEQPRQALPPALVGRWRSEDLRYAGRVLELEPRRVRILAEGRLVELHDVARIDVDEAAGGRVVYRVRFRASEGYDDALTLTLEPGARSRLLVGAQPAAWTRSP